MEVRGWDGVESVIAAVGSAGGTTTGATVSTGAAAHAGEGATDATGSVGSATGGAEFSGVSADTAAAAVSTASAAKATALPEAADALVLRLLEAAGFSDGVVILAPSLTAGLKGRVTRQALAALQHEAFNNAAAARPSSGILISDRNI